LRGNEPHSRHRRFRTCSCERIGAGRRIATALAHAAESLAGDRGYHRISLSYGIANDAARRLYEGLGYRDAGLEPQRVRGPIRVRTGILEVDDTLIYLVKDLPVDSSRFRSSYSRQRRRRDT
jgi:ribosomal protein S18 acetylase RimI-like enzyme